jgi:hypothetical protein
MNGASDRGIGGRTLSGASDRSDAQARGIGGRTRRGTAPTTIPDRCPGDSVRPMRRVRPRRPATPLPLTASVSSSGPRGRALLARAQHRSGARQRWQVDGGTTPGAGPLTMRLRPARGRARRRSRPWACTRRAFDPLGSWRLSACCRRGTAAPSPLGATSPAGAPSCGRRSWREHAASPHPPQPGDYPVVLRGFGMLLEPKPGFASAARHFAEHARLPFRSTMGAPQASQAARGEAITGARAVLGETWALRCTALRDHVPRML